MEQLTDHHYEVLTVPEDSAANCIYIKGPSKVDFLLHRPAEECPDSVSVSTAQDLDLKLQLHLLYSQWTLLYLLVKALETALLYRGQ